MTLTQKLLRFLQRIFEKDPLPFLAFRLVYDGTMSWEVADGELTTSVTGGSGFGLSVDLSQYTLSSLATYLDAQTGYSITDLTSDNSSLSAMVLIDSSGDTAFNDAELTGYTNPLWAFLGAASSELKQATVQVREMIKQMSTRTSSADRKRLGVFTWADLQGVSTTYNSITKTSSSTGSDAGARSRQRHSNGCVAEFRSGGFADKAAGITQAPAQDNALSGIEFAFVWKINGDLTIAEAGIDRGIFGTYTPATRTRIEYDAETVRYYIDDALARTVTGQSGKQCFLAVSIQTPGASLLDVSYGPYGSAEAEWLDELGSYYDVPRISGELDPSYGRRIIAEVLLPKGNNVAIADALSQATGGRTARIIDAVNNPPNGANSLLNLFDAVFGFDFLVDDFNQYTANVLAIIDRLRCAGTHLRQIELNGSISDSMPASGWSDSGLTMNVDTIVSDNNFNLAVLRRYDGTYTHNGAISYNSSNSDVLSLTINTGGVITNEVL